jgi:hypothetical protein
MVELLRDPGEIANAVTVAVEEASGVDVIDDRAAPPLPLGHFPVAHQGALKRRE